MKNLPESLAKITRPVPQNIFFRDKFFHILDKCREKPLIWVYGPPGSGKTTLVASYIEARRLPSIWYQVDRGDNDPGSFFHYMGLAARKADPRKKKPLPHFTPEYALGLKAFSREYFSELYSRLGPKALLVFDNFQEATFESALHEIIHEGLDALPKKANIIIVSRAAPPPVFSRMRLAQSMETVSWEELRLTPDEVRGIAYRKRGRHLSDEQVRNLLSSTDGWLAGLVLLLGRGTDDFGPERIDRHNPAEVFDYFAGGFFQKLEADFRDFLLKTSLFPAMTPAMAESLTGNRRSAAMLSELVEMNYFIQDHSGEEASYQYHNLFREFLLSRLKRESSPEALAEIEKKAAGILAENGYSEEAAALFRSANDLASLAGLIFKDAPSLIRQGRYLTLKDWLEGMGEKEMAENPFLWFWKGRCYFHFDQEKSALFFEKAFQAARAARDPVGVFMSWSGAVEALIHRFDTLKTLDRWIATFDGLLKEYGSFPSKEVEVRSTIFMFLALSFRAPEHPDMGLWAEKTLSLLNEIPDPDASAQAGLCLVDYFVWTGDLEKANMIVERLTNMAERQDHSPFARITVKLSEALNYLYRGRLEECVGTVSEGLRISETKGMNVFDYFLYGHGAVCSLTSGDLNGAERFLKKAVSVMDERKKLCASYYHHIEACHRLLKKDLPGALEHEKLSLSLAVETGSPFAEAMSRAGLALLRFELGERLKGFEEAARARALAVRIGSKLVVFVAAVFEAWFALESGKRRAAIEKLKEAFALGSRQGFVNFHMWRPDIMAELCALAIEEGIETDYAKRLIRERDLFPEAPPLGIDEWPWRLKIYTLGRFAVYKDGAQMQFGRKTPKKPIEMLKLLISLGGRNVPENKISDALWHDSEGDAAHVAFTTTLKRLRSLLGIDDSILLREGRLALNPRYTWVDVWKFNHTVDSLKVSLGETDFPVKALEDAIELYGDGFQIEQDENPWVILFYEGVREKYISAVASLGSHWEKAGATGRAIECYRKGIEVESLSEELYQRLMVSLEKQGRRAEALALYKRLARALSEVLGIEPSPKTKNIYLSLSTGR